MLNDFVNPGKFPARPFTATEILAIEESCRNGSHLIAEGDYAVHPTGDRIYAIGDNLYLLCHEDDGIVVSNRLSALLAIYES